MVLALVVLSIIVWRISGDRIGAIASTTAMCVAGIPLLIDTLKDPKQAPTILYFGYFVAGCLSTAGGKDWSVGERLYSASAAAFCLLVAVVSLRKFLRKKP